MTREELMNRICPADNIRECCSEYCTFVCEDCNNMIECMLLEYEKQFRDKIIADTMDLFLDALKTYDTYGYEDNYLIKLSKENEKDYVPYIHLEDVIKCANGTVKMLKGE